MPDFDDPRYEHRPLPPVPVPSWSAAASSNSGKRLVEEDDEQCFGANGYPDVKRQRLIDPDHADTDDDIAQSVERDEPMQGAETVLPTSQIIIHDSQSSPQGALLQSTRHQALPKNCPTSRRPSHKSTSEQSFSPSKRLKFDQVSERSADLSIPTYLHFDSSHGKTQALLTPPSDASKKSSNGEAKHFLAHSSRKKPSPTDATASRLKRPSTVKNDIYDMEESDEIECSLMSPNSKVATVKKLSRSSSGPKSSSKASRNRKESETPNRFNGTVPNSEVIKLMEDGAFIQPASSKGPRRATAYGTPEYKLTEEEDGYRQPGDALHVRNASVNVWHLPGEHISFAQSNKPVARPFTTISLPENSGWSQAHTDNGSEDIATETNAAGSSTPKATIYEDEVDSGDDASVATRNSPTSKGKKPPLSLRDKIAAASKQVPKTTPEFKKKRKRQRRYQIEVEKSENLLTVDTAYARLDTKQSTPMDSPGEQLLEMQASSQKSRQDSQTNTKKNKKRARIERERQEITAGTPKLSATDEQAREKQVQKPKLVGRAQAVRNSLTVDTKIAKEQARSEAASKSPYARPSPPKGSIGLGVTNSPRRPSILSASGSSLSPRKLFQTESALAQVIDPVALTDKKSGSDSSDESSDESPDSAIATPSKQALQEKSLSPYQRYIAKPKPGAEPLEATANSILKSELALRSENPTLAVIPTGVISEHYESIKNNHKDAVPNTTLSTDAKAKKELEAQVEQALPARILKQECTPSVAAPERSETPAVPFITLPKGMTMEQYESIKNRNKDAPPKARRPDPKVTKQLEAQAKRALLARSSTTGSTSSVAASDEPEFEANTKKAPKTVSAAVAPATPNGITTTQQKQANKKPEATLPKKAIRQTTKSTITPSTTASESSKGSQPPRAKATQAATAPTDLATVKPKGKAIIPAGSEPGSLLKNLKHRVAGQSARNSPAAPPFALAPTPVVRGFNALDEESDDDSESEDEDDVEEKRVNVVRAARPDQSTRSVVVDEDVEDSEDEEEEED
jgi:hypothetical protein